MYQEKSGIIERIVSVWENVQISFINLPEAEKDDFILTPEFISRTSTDTNLLLGLYARQTLKSDLLSSTELENDRVGANDYRRKGKAVKTIVEFSSSSNPSLAQEVFTSTKRNLLIDTSAIEHNNAVRNEGISRIDLSGL